MRKTFLGLCLGVLCVASCTIYEDHFHYPPAPNACYGQSAKASDGDFCSSDTQCCSGSCSEEGTCCEQPGARCSLDYFGNGNCCVGSCNGSACVCNPVGQRCSRYSDCCSGDCANGRCVAGNTTCAADGDCASGTCDHFVCRAPTDLAVSSPDGLVSVDLATQD